MFLSKNRGAQIITCFPRWKNGIDVTFLTATTIVEAISGREERNTRFQRPFISMTFTAVNLESSVSGYFRKMFENRGDRPVGMPLWFDAASIQATTAGTTVLPCEARNRLFPWYRYALLWSGPFSYELVTITAIGSGTVTISAATTMDHASGSLLVPVAFGKMEIPDSTYSTPDVSDVEVSFDEMPGVESFTADGQGKVGLATVREFLGHLNSQAGTPIVQDFTRFTIRPNWKTPPAAGAVDDIFYEPLAGGVPVPYSTYKINRRVLQLSYTLDRYDLQKVLRHFEHHDGCRGSYWIPTWTHDYTLAAAVAVGATSITIKPSGLAKMPERYGAFFAFSGKNLILIKASTVTTGQATETITLTAPLTVALDKGSQLCGAIYGRIRDDELSVHCDHPSTLFKVSTEFLETPEDLETNNTSKTAYLYRIQRGDVTSLWCNWQYAIEAKTTIYGDFDSYTWRGADVHHDAIEHSEKMLGEDLELICNGVLREHILSERPDNNAVEVEIYKVNMANYDPSNVPAAESLFKGIIIDTSIDMDGQMTVKLSSDLRVLERSMPRFKLQRQCNYLLYSEQCGANKANFTVSAMVTSVNGRTATVEISTTKPEKFFTGAQLIDADGNKHIVLKDVGTYTTRTFTVDSNISTGSVLLIAWCDKSIHCCANRFGNAIHFGGCPYLPNNNPIEQVSLNDSVGGKK